MKTLQTSPKKDGYRMPGEFEAHKDVYLLWPERPDNWREGAKPAQATLPKSLKQLPNLKV